MPEPEALAHKNINPFAAAVLTLSIAFLIFLAASGKIKTGIDLKHFAWMWYASSGLITVLAIIQVVSGIQEMKKISRDNIPD